MYVRRAYTSALHTLSAVNVSYYYHSDYYRHACISSRPKHIVNSHIDVKQICILKDAKKNYPKLGNQAKKRNQTFQHHTEALVSGLPKDDLGKCTPS